MRGHGQPRRLRIDLGRPEEQRDVFSLLRQAGYLDQGYTGAMIHMVGFRNRLVHLYWDVDVERLYRYLHEDVGLLERFRDFILQLLEVEKAGAPRTGAGDERDSEGEMRRICKV